ncbi:MAG: hypothetical protein INQ03_13875 [Candidatus Heimdallarchaeota archaeon]|nr:hypothetical protein [Candidatus Heimdallarchaeota archaeon]
MAILFVPQTLLYSGIILAVVALFTFIFFKPAKTEKETINFTQIIIALILSYLLLLIGVWLWFFFGRPTIVGITWFFIPLIFLIALASPGIAAKDPDEMVMSPVRTIFLMIAFMYFISKIVIIAGIIVFVFLVIESGENATRDERISKSVAWGTGIIMFLILGSMFVFTPVDNAEYFDDIIVYDDGLPFNSKVEGHFLRVVDYELAEKIMLKSNFIGSNTHVTDIHLGKINDSTYWIGAVSFTGNKFIRSDLNHYQAFIAVDFRDPGIEPIVIRQEFHVGPELAMNKKLSRVVYNHDKDYRIGDNVYFTMGENQKMRLMVPYAIQSPVFLGPSVAGFITQEIQKLGGVLEISSDGTIVKDYRDLSELPKYAQVQYYSEYWLERCIDYWGRSFNAPHDFGVMTHWGGIFKSQWLMGIDDDIRVIVSPDDHTDVQFTLLDSTGSDNQILRGAIKANASGIYYYNWADYGYIDTNSAHEHGETALTNHFGNTVHGYSTQLPILYPIVDDPQSLEDYAYVMPLLFRDVRFGGVVVTDPADATGEHSSVVISETNQKNISVIVSEAIELYFDTSNDHSRDGLGTFNITSKTSYVEDGYTVYVMNGSLTLDNITTYEIVVFKQEQIAKLDEWLIVVNAQIGDTLLVDVTIIDGVLHARTVDLPN